MYLLTVFSPLLASSFLFLFGRFLGARGSSFLALFSVFFSFFLSLILFFEVVVSGTGCFVLLPFSWFSLEILVIEWVFLFDTLSSTMLIVVFFVSCIVHFYSLEYMSEDPHIIRFIAYLSFFTFFMAILLTSGNLIQMFLGWEGVGLSSYLLINFWFTRIQANKSALKAMVINRVGDWGLSFGIFFIFFYFGTVDFFSLFSLSTYFLSSDIIFLGFNLNLADCIAFFLFFGVAGKSAQFGLHTWLPDAMEGPTPVSALIHAATMVTAGVFLMIRCSHIFEFAGITLFIVSFLSALTAFFGSTVACFQTDIKKIIAYSTCSQLGYMIFACSFSLYSTGLFHFFNHAFFKALLFLSAGSVIHALVGEQDIYLMGSLDVYLPFTAQMFFIGSFSLASFPFLSGFYSKDWILEVASSFFYFDGLLMLLLVSQAAVFTMMYSDSLHRFIFDGEENFPTGYILNVGESGSIIVSSLFILALPSIFSGFIFKDLFIGFGNFIFDGSIFLLPNSNYFYEAEFLPILWKVLPVITSLFSFFLVILGFDFLYHVFIILKDLWVRIFLFFRLFLVYFVDFFTLVWYYDAFVNFFVVKFLLNFCKETTYKLMDKGVLEYIGPYALVEFFSFSSRATSNIISGYIYHYAFLIIFGFGLLLNFTIFSTESITFDLFFVLFFFFLSFFLNFKSLLTKINFNF